MWAWCEMRLPLCPRGIRQGDGAGFIVLLTLLFLLVTPWRDRGCRRGPGLVTPPEGIHGRGAASPLPSMFGRASIVSAAIISCIMIKTETGGRGCAVLFHVSLLRDVSLGVPLLALGSGGQLVLEANEANENVSNFQAAH